MPITITSTDVTNVAAEFSTESQSRIELFIENARLFVNEDFWGAKAKLGIIYYTAHLLKMSQLAASGAAGPVTSERVGDLQRSYGSSASSENSDLATTAYGQMILALRKTLLVTPMVV